MGWHRASRQSQSVWRRDGGGVLCADKDITCEPLLFMGNEKGFVG